MTVWYDVFICIHKLIGSQLSLSHGTVSEKNVKELKLKTVGSRRCGPGPSHLINCYYVDKLSYCRCISV